MIVTDKRGHKYILTPTRLAQCEDCYGARFSVTAESLKNCVAGRVPFDCALKGKTWKPWDKHKTLFPFICAKRTIGCAVFTADTFDKILKTMGVETSK
jgi:hypothetical protein